MQSIKCEVFGETVPPPFQIDVSKLDYNHPYTAIRLKDLECLLPDDGKTLFDRHYTLDEEVVWAYIPNTVRRSFSDRSQRRRFQRTIRTQTSLTVGAGALT